MPVKKIVVVGGGPAGMMAAMRAGELGQNVTLLEKNPYLGKKLLLSGKGRCNLTNTCTLDLFLKRFGNNGQFLRDAFKKFFHPELISFFETRELPLKVERQLRVFPVTDKADSIRDLLVRELLRQKVEVLYKAQMKDILLKGSCVSGVIFSGGEQIPADKVILATGGISYAFTGSSGEGLKAAEKLGHHIVRLRQGLVALETEGRAAKLLEGLTLKNIRLRFSNAKNDLISEIGELLFTDFGISGPLVLSLSGRIVDWLNEYKSLSVEIDLKPALSRQQLDERLLREFKASPKKTIANVLKNLLPQRLVEVFLQYAKIDSGKRVSQIIQAERLAMIVLLKGLPFKISRPRPMSEAMVTQGGVSLKEINPRTCESRLVKGLYFAGEIMDIDADTGGFNLQAAFSTGYLAGESAALN